MAREISRITRYADRVIHLDPPQGDRGVLLDGIEARAKGTACSSTMDRLVDSHDPEERSVFLFHGNFNSSTDIQGTRLVYPMEGEAMRFLDWAQGEVGSSRADCG